MTQLYSHASPISLVYFDEIRSGLIRTDPSHALQPTFKWVVTNPTTDSLLDYSPHRLTHPHSTTVQLVSRPLYRLAYVLYPSSLLFSS